ncbi:MAG: SRPBCC family protein [Acidobacteriota bacterium]
MPRPMTIEAHGDLEIVVVRHFDAPRDLVFDAWTRPDLLRQWLGVHNGWTMPRCEVDLRIGGSYRYVWHGPGGEVMGVRGEFRDIVAPERIVCTEAFDESWYSGGALITNKFEETPDGTRCRLTIRYESEAARDGVLASPMEQGMEAGFRALDDLVADGPI